MWEVKDAGDSIADYSNPHDVDNTYSWSWAGEDPDGSAFEFIDSPKISVFAGYADWRLPNIEELKTIMEYGVRDPEVNEAMPSDTASDCYWSSTVSADETHAWPLNFSYAGEYRLRAVSRSDSFPSSGTTAGKTRKRFRAGAVPVALERCKAGLQSYSRPPPSSADVFYYRPRDPS